MSFSKFEEGEENYSDNFWKVEINSMLLLIIFRKFMKTKLKIEKAAPKKR
jgi:hypothetical protein